MRIRKSNPKENFEADTIVTMGEETQRLLELSKVVKLKGYFMKRKTMKGQWQKSQLEK